MPNQPNILLLITDQHNPRIAGFAGDPLARTEALDRLAARSTSFDAAYCQSPLCVPSRTSFLTGKWAFNCSAWNNNSVLFPEHVTLPAWFARQGYATATVGKMHFRGGEQMHGWEQRPYGDLVESIAATHQPDPPETADGRWNRHSVGRFPFAGTTRIPESLLVDQAITTESLAWLREYAASGDARPWLFCASYSRPHFPLTAPERYVRRYLDSDLRMPPLPGAYPDGLHPHDRFIVDDFNLLRFSEEDQRRALACYYACVDYVDDCIAALLEGLERDGLLENTYIVYTSDHGDMAGEHGLWWKRTYYDASARVPLLLAGPDVHQGRRVEAPTELVDLFPTMCDWAGVETPSGLDGESLVPSLGSSGGQRRKRVARCDFLGGQPFRMARDERWKLVEFPDAPWRLFDMLNDPGETCDLSASPPPEAPVQEIHRVLAQGGAWDELAQRAEADRARRETLKTVSLGTVQYRLADGTLLEGDAHLYPKREGM